MSDDRKIIRVSAESDKAIRTYADRKGVEVGEAVDALIATAVSRLNALTRYKKTKDGGAPKGKPKKAAKKAAAKKASAKKTSANGAAAHA
jgi:hypothetical protein